MDTRDLDEEAKQKRRKEQIEFRTKKRASVRFMLLSSLFEIFETVLIMFLLFFIVSFILFRVFKATGPTGQTVFQILLIAIFIGGMILGFIVYKKCARWYILKFNLKSKLNEEVLIHYFKDEELDLEDSRLK